MYWTSRLGGPVIPSCLGGLQHGGAKLGFLSHDVSVGQRLYDGLPCGCVYSTCWELVHLLDVLLGRLCPMKSV